MFSNNDIQELFQALPPQKSGNELGSLPSLLSSTSQGFLTAQHVYTGFRRLATEGTSRVPLSVLSDELKVDNEAIAQMVRASPALTIFNVKKDHAILQDERNYIFGELKQAIDCRIVTKSVFSKDYNVSVESIDLLTPSLDLYQDLSPASRILSEGQLIGTSYHQLLSKDIKGKLDGSVEQNSSVTLDPVSLLGTPPMWFLSEIVDQVLQSNDLLEQFHVSKSTEEIRCVPKQYVLRNRDARIDSLSSGELPCTDVVKFSKEFHEIYPSTKEAQEHLQSLPGITINGSTAVSEAWITKFGDQCIEALEVLGYADLTPQIEEHFPSETQAWIRERLEQHIKPGYEKRSGTAASIAGYFLLTAERYASERDVILGSAKAHADHKWKQLLEIPEKDIKFQMADIVAFIPSSQPILQAISEDKSVKAAAEEAFWNEVLTLEVQNEAEFADFWSSRVVARVSNYSTGLNTIEDTKLRDQLSELLSTYVIKELLPETITKGKSQGLVNSRKTKKNVQKLESTLKPGKDLASLLTSLDKFAKKQAVSELDVESLEKAKTTFASDMVRKMQKQSDAPTLFLITVLALFAKHNAGMIYATGKFAPKLMKQLKSAIKVEEYEQLEQWKEAAKAGTLSKEDKEAMKKLAGDELL